MNEESRMDTGWDTDPGDHSDQRRGA